MNEFNPSIDHQKLSLSRPVDLRQSSIRLLMRSDDNPIMRADPSHGWEAGAVFNPAALRLNGKIHLVYRAISRDGLSVFGYAHTEDGIHIDERLPDPIYIPTDKSPRGGHVYAFTSGHNWGGFEDPRLTHVGDFIYMTYTFFDGSQPPAVAMTFISVDDFLAKKWTWSPQKMLSPPGQSHKNWVIFPEKFNGKFAVLHSITPRIMIDYIDDLQNEHMPPIHSQYSSKGRDRHWDTLVRGVGAPPLRTEEGWLIFYHAMDRRAPNGYKIGAMVLDLEDPTKILYRANVPLLEPQMDYERHGYTANVTYVCGTAIIEDTLFVYYGGADTVVCAATVNLHEFLAYLKLCPQSDDLHNDTLDLLERSEFNPILTSRENESWEGLGAFNPCVVENKGTYHMLYRGQGDPVIRDGKDVSLSSIGYATSKDGIRFKDQRRLIAPTEVWEKFGCEDPRVTYMDGKYYIFYTALSTFPFTPQGIRIAVAVSKDLKTIDEKHPVTPFNGKAMALFPEKINGKFVAILTVHSDLPPAKVALAHFERQEDMWSDAYWSEWYDTMDSHVIPLLRSPNDHVEVGAPPIKTDRGWLCFYSYIQNYFSEEKIFGIEAVLLDLEDPSKIIGRTDTGMMIPDADHEVHGYVPNVVFPSGALLKDKKILAYYGAADTSGCVAIGDLEQLLEKLTQKEPESLMESRSIPHGFRRFSGNPILTSRYEFSCEGQSVFNPAAIYLDDRVHILYRCESKDRTSRVGYASSRDGFHVDERLNIPIYGPREPFEQKTKPGNSGCEDPRLTRIGDKIYMLYTAYDGYVPRVAITSIHVDDFLEKQWHWSTPKIISPSGAHDKNSCIFPRKVKDKYVMLHRIDGCIYINFLDSLTFDDGVFLEQKETLFMPSDVGENTLRIGACAAPIETEKGWLFFYHMIVDGVYKVGILLLDLDDPRIILRRTDSPVLEPEMQCEKVGDVNNVVFPCGVIRIKDDIFLYYGGADKVVSVATLPLSNIFQILGV